ncbi:MAG: hypothetical protein QNK27_07340, partial [Desulfuromusa sp.]|nr:hypothetical protein [Desulfuromusa sp.]
ISALFITIVMLILSLHSTPVKAQPVAGRILDGVQISEQAGKVDVSVDFNFPVRYISHFPDAAGQELRIRLQPISASADDLEALTKRESLAPGKNNPANIAEIIYEGDTSSGLFLTIFFRGKTDFTVRQGANYRSLQITVVPPTPVMKKEGSVAINLESSLAGINIAEIPPLDSFKSYQLYTSRHNLEGKIWHRLRLGFFSDSVEANKVLAEVIKHYPQAWVSSTSQAEKLAAAEFSIPYSSLGQLPQPAVPIIASAPESGSKEKPGAKPLTLERQTNLQEEAKVAMATANYRRAVQIYTKLVEAGDAATRQQAQEYLGLARDRGNQKAHAKAEYEKYLTLYPEGEGAERVKQRLAGILTAAATPKMLRKAGGKAEGKTAWRKDVFGSFSQYYDRDETLSETDDDPVNRSNLSTNIDLNARFRSEDYDVRATFVGGYENDFLDSDENETRVSSLYVDAMSHKYGLSTRVGRQSRSSGGILGRFDGALVRWQFHDKVGVNLIGGFPVASSRNTDIDTDRPLYGISFDLGTFAEHWDFNTFFVNQDVEGIVDRQAVGGEVRFFHRNYSFFSLVDYDILYDQLNTVLFTSNWNITDKTRLNVSANYRQSPFLTTSNALIGQPVTSIDALLETFSEGEIRQLALDRTATSRSYILSVTQTLTEKLQISADLYVSKFTGTDSSGGVLGFDGTDYDYFYSMQFIGSSLIKEGDISILGLRYSDTSTSDSYSFSLNTRYPLTRNLRLNPRFVVDYRTNKHNDGEKTRIRPLVRLEYRWKRRYHVELEGGGEWSNESFSTLEEDRNGYFLRAGYRITF